jgi:hypothetical protein
MLGCCQWILGIPNEKYVSVTKDLQELFVAAVKRVRAAHPDKIIVAGNVVTGLIFDPGFLGA